MPLPSTLDDYEEDSQPIKAAVPSPSGGNSPSGNKSGPKKVTPLSRPVTITLQVVTAISVLLGLILVYAVVTNGSSFESQSQENAAQLKVLQDKANGLNEKATRMDEKSMSKKIVSTAQNATEAGSKVVTLQNNYASFGSQSSPDTQESDGFSDNVKQLDALLGADSKNERTPWYSVESVKDKSVSPMWEFETTYDFTEDTTDVLWLCRDTKTKDKANSILGYATGTYNAKDKVFTNVSHYMTGHGASLVMSTDDSDGEHNNQLMDELGKNKDTSPPISQEDRDAINKNRELAKKENEGKQ